jgi:predicted membrane protein
MNDAVLRTRLDTILLLLATNALLLFGIGFRYAREITVGVAVLSGLVGYGLVRGRRSGSLP